MLSRVSAILGALVTTVTSVLAADLPAPPAAPVPAMVSLPTFYVHVGAAGLFYDIGTRLKLAGAPVPGAAVRIADTATFAVEGGYFVTPNIAVSATGGIPPMSKIVAAGTLAGFGTVAKTVGGPTAVTVHYHLTTLGAFQPYVGVGVAALLIFNDEDRLLRKFSTDSTAGPVVQGGFDLMLDDRWGVFVDLKKAFLTAKSKGFLGAAPVRSSVALDPLVLHSGLTYRF